MIQTAQVLNLSNAAKKHSHLHHQLVLGLQGGTEFEVEGKENKVNPGQGCLLPSSTTHSFCGQGKNRIFVVNVPPDMGAIPSNNPITKTVLDFNQLFNHTQYFALDGRTQVLIEALSFELDHNQGDSLLIHSCAYTVLNAVCRQILNVCIHHHVRQLNMTLIDQYIDLHLAEQIQVDQLAHVSGMSVSQFYALFRSQSGQTPHQYLLDRRLETARDYLTKGVMQLTDIAATCGFSSQSSFTQAFSRCSGISPARFRKKFQ